MKRVRVLIVDDSRTMRLLIGQALTRDPEIEVVGESQDPYEAREAIKALDPDVVTLDINMPRMNGLDFLERIMRLRPTRVIVVSSLTAQGAMETIRALEIGAMDCVAKPSANDPDTFNELPLKVRAIAAAPLRPPRNIPSALPSQRTHADYESDGRIVAIGASMGGVEALPLLLSAFPRNCPPTVIVQHMPAFFTRSFASRLNKHCLPLIQEATDGYPLRAGEVLLAPGGAAHLEIENAGGLHCRLVEGPLVTGHRPSVDAMFRSVAIAAGRNAIGVILTGMGRDGAAGLLDMRGKGAATFGQDKATCLVYGMPRAAVEIGAVQEELPLGEIAAKIIAETNSKGARNICR